MYKEIFCWNVRGFNIASHRCGFRKWLRVNKPIFRGLIETHVKQPKSMRFINELLPGWCLEESYSFSILGRIWVIWHPSVKVIVIKKSLQMITCEVLLPKTQHWFVVSIIYASNEKEERQLLWEEIKDLSTSQ